MFMQRSRHHFDRLVTCEHASFRCACTRAKLQAVETPWPTSAGKLRHLRRWLLSFRLRARGPAGAHGCRRRLRGSWVRLRSGFLGAGGRTCFAHGCMLPTARACLQQVWVGLLADCLRVHPLLSAVARGSILTALARRLIQTRHEDQSIHLIAQLRPHPLLKLVD